MDKNHNINEHSEIKLDIYINYLKAYLSIIKNVDWVSGIEIYDIFAGQGKSDNGVEGSSLRAFREILAYKQGYTRPIDLFLNDIDSSNVLKLKQYIDTQKFPFVHITNTSADSFITNLKNKKNYHSLMFIDPYGYTKIRGENLDKIFFRNNTDIIMFIPVFHIYRFLRKQTNDTQLAPIAQFLKDMGIDENEIKKQHTDLDRFCELIKNAICNKSKTEACSYYRISHESKQSEYALYFCSKSLKGLEQFIASMKKTDNQHKKTYQLSLLADAPEQYIIDELNAKESLTNKDLYKLGILKGYYSAEINQHLRTLEYNNKIVVEAINGQIRKRGAFYIGFNNDKKIRVTLK